MRALTYLLGIQQSTTIQIILIAVITSFAPISVVLGLDRRHPPSESAEYVGWHSA